MRRFYEGSPERGLRLGDVLTGFQLTTPMIDDPGGDSHREWRIAVAKPAFLVVMTPCCSIERESIILVPLSHVRPSFLNNEFFVRDLTEMNHRVAPEHSMPRDAWEHLSPAKKQEFMVGGAKYVFLDCFIYAPNDLLPNYPLNRKGRQIEMRHYMVDFKNMCRVDSKKIKRRQPAPQGTKILQLTAHVRQELRDKLAYYFARIPEEDARYLGG